MGRRRRRSSGLEGVLLVDKPAGPTSHDVVDQLRRALGEQRIGHTGTLDPAATGVLVLCVGRSTKLVRFLQAGTKTYAARMVLGVETDSQDADGRIVAERDAGHLDERTVCEALGRFQGTIEQLPPMVSAVQVGGRRLHELARAGAQVERPTRTVTVHDLVLDGFEPGPHPQLSFLVTCSAGTYVRTIAHDLGEQLGVGGSLTALRRLANGPFTVEECRPLAQLLEEPADAIAARLIDPRTAVTRILPVVDVDDPAEARRLTQGGRRTGGPQPGPYAAVHAERLLGIYTPRPDGDRPELVWTRPEELA